MTVRPRRAEVAAHYDAGVDAYDSLWSPVILPPARQVVTSLELDAGSLILDVGTGTGALIPTIKAAAPAATVVGLDAAAEMLRMARAHTGAPVLRADAAALPIADATVDAALFAFVLFHLSDPGVAIAEAVRVLRRGGRVGTVTWTRESTLHAYEVWDATLTEAGALPPPSPRVDAGLDTKHGIDAMLTTAGLRPTRIWLEPLSHQWEPATYWQLATGSGFNRTRLQRLDPDARREVLAVAQERLDILGAEDYAWSGEVVCAIALKPD
jgi:SAM-dependent methyltransferase